MHERIGAMLGQIEREHGCRVLYACESGSRAWGFASPDSDYDVRFIHAHPLAWHLRLEARRDSIERMTPDNLDLAGWELGKALRLFAGCNLALNEWLDSPEIYRSEPDFHQVLRGLIPAYFNPRKALHHYLAMAEKTADQHLAGGRVGIKKAFYILRPLLACRWIIDRLAMPPTRFEDLLRQPLPPDLGVEIQALLERKAGAVEGEKIPLPPALGAWFGESCDFARRQAEQLPATAERDWAPLNNLMARWVPSA